MNRMLVPISARIAFILFSSLLPHANNVAKHALGSTFDYKWLWEGTCGKVQEIALAGIATYLCNSGQLFTEKAVYELFGYT
jgi:hypothetical protein